MRYLIIDTEQEGSIIGLAHQSEFEIDGKILTEEESLKVFEHLSVTSNPIESHPQQSDPQQSGNGAEEIDKVKIWDKCSMVFIKGEKSLQKCVFDMMKEYARLCVEADRKKIVEECTKFIEWTCPTCGDGHGYIEAERKSILNRPIDLI